MGNRFDDQAGVDAAAAATDLLAWYDRARRTLPWRARPGERPDPYRVWLSEVMLQQTTVAAAIPYFDRFVARWPDVMALAAAPLDDILKAWAGLGYYARARNLHACARHVAGEFGGAFPAAAEALAALPGIGPYTAAAVAAIAFGAQAVPVDGNVERVVARLWAIGDELPRARPAIRARAGAFLPCARPGDLAQALMDLGATVCTPRRPDCPACPLRAACAAHARGIAAGLPRRAPRSARPVRRAAAFWAEREDGAVLVRRRPPRGLLGGMTEFPSSEWREGAFPAGPAAAPLPARWRRLPGVVRHVFSHFALELEIWRAEVGTPPPPSGTRFVAAQALAGEALPGVMRKVAAHARAGAPADRLSRRPSRRAPAGAGGRSA